MLPSASQYGTRRLAIRPRYVFSHFLLVGVMLAAILPGAHAQAQSPAPPAGAHSDAASMGQWSAVQGLATVPVHAILLPTGKVLIFGAFNASRTPFIWDPATGRASPAAPIGYDIFCGGHSLFANGQVMVSGGAISDDVGVANASVYNAVTNTWTALPAMNDGRWYPTSTTLANGDILTSGGDISHTPNTVPQIWQNATQSWLDLTGAQLMLPLYPRMFVAPNGQVVLAGTDQVTRYLDTTGAGQWTVLGNLNVVDRSYGSTVMYDVGKLIIFAGADPPLASTEMIDLTQPTTKWTFGASLPTPLRQFNATILADGKVLISGGSSLGGFDNKSGAVYPSQLWDPATGLFTTMASLSVYRGYHSTALLLPDGRVFSAGGALGGATYEVFSPPYLFNGAQPTISSAPVTAAYGQTFFVATPDAASISQVNMISLGAATHAFNQSQRISRLGFTQATGGLNVTAPASGELAPPGCYMLFIITSGDVPSVAAMVQLGTAPAVTLAPASLTFGNQTVGTISPPQTVTLTVTASGSATNLTIASMVPTGDFAQTNTCGALVAPGASCTISVTFVPTAPGPRTGAITITDNAGNSPQVITLSGTGIGPSLSLSTNSLTFGNQTLGTTSASQMVTLTNTGTGKLNFNSLILTGANRTDFTQVHTCVAGLQPGASCTLTVTFTPSAVGTRVASSVLSDNAPDTPQTISLTGTGISGTVVFSPPSLTFANQNLGTTSAPQTLTLMNGGASTLAVSSVALTGSNNGDFAQTNNCVGNIASGSTCTITVTFTPLVAGNRNAFVSVTDNGPGSPQTAAISGNGVGPGVQLAPSSLVFPDQTVGTTSASQTVTLTNTGNASLTVNSLFATGNFSQGNTCAAGLVAGASCTITVTFTPLTSGPLTGNVVITDNAPGGTHMVPLSGTGTLPAVMLSPTSVSFGGVALGHQSGVFSVTITNTGIGTLFVTGVAITGADASEFSQTNTCAGSVLPGNNCSVSMQFSPANTGTRTATLTITDNAANSPQTVPLTGVGVSVVLAPFKVNYVTQVIGTSAMQTATLQNYGSTAVTINSVTITGVNSSDFTQTNTCGASLAAFATCVITVTFTPTTSGLRTAQLMVMDSASTHPQLSMLMGTGTGVTVSPTLVKFFAQKVGTTSPPMTVTLTNAGNVPLSVTSFTITGPSSGDFAQTNNCPSSLAVAANCAISVTFTPTLVGMRTATLVIADSDATSPQKVNLTGTGK